MTTFHPGQSGLRDGEANRKVLVFTAFADTARYLYQYAGDRARNELHVHTALVCGDGGNATTLRRTDYDDILTDFSPRAKRRADQKTHFHEQTAEIDLLIATDCISEGQNLQDCDLLINYDILPAASVRRGRRIRHIASQRLDATKPAGTLLPGLRSGRRHGPLHLRPTQGNDAAAPRPGGRRTPRDRTPL